MSKELDLEQLEHVAGGLPDSKQAPAQTKQEKEDAADRERRKQAIRENSREIEEWYREQLRKKR